MRDPKPVAPVRIHEALSRSQLALTSPSQEGVYLLTAYLVRPASGLPEHPFPAYHQPFSSLAEALHSAQIELNGMHQVSEALTSQLLLTRLVDLPGVLHVGAYRVRHKQHPVLIASVLLTYAPVELIISDTAQLTFIPEHYGEPLQLLKAEWQKEDAELERRAMQGN